MFYLMGGEWLIFPIIGLAVMLVMIAFVFRIGDRAGDTGPWCMGGSARRDRRETDALDILRQRFAAGELSGERFDDMRRRLDER
ncbi:MAG: hypothetical protein M0Z49_00530 [Chloroflexi bacterium]|nr:hypothetical protein [Chloroflexota bacterium]